MKTETQKLGEQLGAMLRRGNDGTREGDLMAIRKAAPDFIDRDSWSGDSVAEIASMFAHWVLYQFHAATAKAGPDILIDDRNDVNAGIRLTAQGDGVFILSGPDHFPRAVTGGEVISVFGFPISIDVQQLNNRNERFARLLHAAKVVDNYWTGGNFSRDPAIWNLLRSAIGGDSIVPDPVCPICKSAECVGVANLPCPICKGVEGCDHARPERAAADLTKLNNRKDVSANLFRAVFIDSISDIADAYNKPGRVPSAHKAEQAKLSANWRTLSNAVSTIADLWEQWKAGTLDLDSPPAVNADAGVADRKFPGDRRGFPGDVLGSHKIQLPPVVYMRGSGPMPDNARRCDNCERYFVGPAKIDAKFIFCGDVCQGAFHAYKDTKPQPGVVARPPIADPDETKAINQDRIAAAMYADERPAFCDNCEGPLTPGEIFRLTTNKTVAENRPFDFLCSVECVGRKLNVGIQRIGPKETQHVFGL